MKPTLPSSKLGWGQEQQGEKVWSEPAGLARVKAAVSPGAYGLSAAWIKHCVET